MPSKKKKYNARFPPARIKKIMQTDEDVGKVAAAVPVVISRALELFIESLISKSADHTKAKNAKTLSASHIKQIILAEKKFDFLKDLVANIPDVQANEEEDMPLEHPPPPKPRAKPPPLAPGQPPRPRGRPKKKREGDPPVSTAVKRRHSDEETKDSESEGTNTEDSDEESDEDELKSPSVTTAPVLQAGPSLYQEQNLPGPSMNPESESTTFHNLLPAAVPPSTDEMASGSGALSSLQPEDVYNQTIVTKYDSQQDVVQASLQVGGISGQTPLLSSLQSNMDVSQSLGNVVNQAINTVQITDPQTLANTVGSQLSSHSDQPASQSSWGSLPHHQPQQNHLLKQLESSEISKMAPVTSDSSRNIYKPDQTAITDSATGWSQNTTDSKVPSMPSPNTAGFLKSESGTYGQTNHTSDTKLGLPTASDSKPGVYGDVVENGEKHVSGTITTAMHPNPLHLETKLQQQGTFEKWSPTKAGVLDLSVSSKRGKDKEDIKPTYTPLNLAASQDYTSSVEDSVKPETSVKSHIKSGEGTVPITGQTKEVKPAAPSSSLPPGGNVDKFPVTGGMNMPGYAPPMMGIPGYPMMSGFPPFGVMPPFNGPNHFGMAPGMMPLPPYASPSGFYLPYQGSAMGYPTTSQPDNTASKQPEPSATKPS